MECSLYRRGFGSRLFDAIIIAILAVVTILTLYPLLYVLVISLSEANLANPYLYLWPVRPHLGNFGVVFRFPTFWQAYANTVYYSLSGALVSVLVTIITSYPLSIRTLPLRRTFMLYITITMLFSGGLIPYFLQVRKLGLVNTRMVMILPGAISAYNVIIMRTFFQTNIPGELRDAAKIDGASDWQILWRMVVPLSKSIIAVIALFTGVGIWNSYFGAMIFLQDRRLFPVALVLRELIVGVSMVDMLPAELRVVSSVAGVRAASLIVSIVPLLAIYPFLQRHFVKGILLGSLKG